MNFCKRTEASNDASTDCRKSIILTQKNQRNKWLVKSAGRIKFLFIGIGSTSQSAPFTAIFILTFAAADSSIAAEEVIRRYEVSLLPKAKVLNLANGEL